LGGFFSRLYLEALNPKTGWVWHPNARAWNALYQELVMGLGQVVIQDSFGSPQNDSPRSEQRSQQVSGARLVNVPIPVFEPYDGQTDTGDDNADDAEGQIDDVYEINGVWQVGGISKRADDAKIPVIQVDDAEIPVIPYIPPGSVEGTIAYQQKWEIWPRWRSRSVFNRVVDIVDTVTDWTPGTSHIKAAAKVIKGDYGDAVGLMANSGLPLPGIATLAVSDYQKDFIRNKLLTPKVLLGPLREPYDRIQGAIKLDWRQALPEVAQYVDIPKQLNAVYWDIRGGHPRQAFREAIDPVLAIASVFGFLPNRGIPRAALDAEVLPAGDVSRSGVVPPIPGPDIYGPADYSLVYDPVTGSQAGVARMFREPGIGGFEYRSRLIANISDGSGGFTGDALSAAVPSAGATPKLLSAGRIRGNLNPIPSRGPIALGPGGNGGFADGGIPNAGAYRDVAGHHIHQSASFSPGRAIHNPNHRAAIAIEQGVPSFTEAQHNLASAAQRNINRAYRGETINQPNVGTLQIEATGGGTLVIPSIAFEDIKAFYALRAAGFSPAEALRIVNLSRAQIDSVGAVPVRVPGR
jgi:hypothetical protein